MNAPTDIPEFDFTDMLQYKLERLQIWRAYIEKALARNDSLSTFTDVVKSILINERVLFDNGEAFAVVQADTHERGTALFVFVAGGRLKALYALEDMLIDYAKHIGASRLTGLARTGFSKRHTPGWKLTKQTWMIKEL
jgi:hypothetical protein